MSNDNTPFNADRLPPVLDGLGIRYRRDGDGDAYADWEGMRLWFLTPGEQNEILAMRALWAFRPPVELYESLVSTLNDWNAAKFWPRASAAIRDERVVVAADLVIDLETGASDDFLAHQVRCMAGTSLEFLEYLTEAYPQYAEWAPAAT